VASSNERGIIIVSTAVISQPSGGENFPCQTISASEAEEAHQKPLKTAYRSSALNISFA
jgi:hypothetical protein